MSSEQGNRIDWTIWPTAETRKKSFHYILIAYKVSIGIVIKKSNVGAKSHHALAYKTSLHSVLEDNIFYWLIKIVLLH